MTIFGIQMKVLENLQQNAETTIDDTFLVILQRVKTVQFVNKQNELNETVAQNSQLRNRTPENGNYQRAS